MKNTEIQKLLKEKGLTPEQIAKIVERYERQKERAKRYQKEKYYKVSVSIKREDVDRISRETGIEPNKVKKYLAGIKLSQALTKEEKEKIKECLKTEVSKGNSVS